MATVSTAIINPALRMIGELASGVSPGTDEASDALIALNAMLQGFNNDGLTCYAEQEESMTLSNGTSSYTIGTSGSPTLNTTRPVKILQAYIRDSNYDYDVEILQNRDQYAAIPDKTTTSSWPDRLWYEPTVPNGTILVYPVPDATRTLKLVTRIAIAEFAATSTTVALPPGWEEMLAANLAVRMAPEYEKDPPAWVVQLARNSKAAIKRMNSHPSPKPSELRDLVGSASSGNILTGP